MELGNHAGFIIASYGLCIMTVLALVAWVRIDKSNQERALKELADQGISRARSDHESRKSR